MHRTFIGTIVGLALVGASTTCPGVATAITVIDVEHVGLDVHVTSSGTLDISSLTLYNSGVSSQQIPLFYWRRPIVTTANEAVLKYLDQLAEAKSGWH